MIFSVESIAAIRAGRKTQTRRPSNRWQAGRDYAVQPQLPGNKGRGGKSVARIEILERSRQRLGEITTIDAVAEGFDSRARFFEEWAQLHGKVELERWVWAYTFRVVGNG